MKPGHDLSLLKKNPTRNAVGGENLPMERRINLKVKEIPRTSHQNKHDMVDQDAMTLQCLL